MTELKMSEAQLQREVINLCKLLRLWHYHPYDSRRSASGWVDLVILGRQALFVELKSEDGRRSIPQIQCSTRIEQAGLQYRCWRPSDLQCGIIQRELEAIA